MNIGATVDWFVWCSECQDIHPLATVQAEVGAHRPAVAEPASGVESTLSAPPLEAGSGVAGTGTELASRPLPARMLGSHSATPPT